MENETRRLRGRTRDIICPNCEKPATISQRSRTGLCADCGGAAQAKAHSFQPTQRQRDDVWAAIALGVSADGLHIGVINPATQRPIDAKTFRKVFAEEIASAKVKFELELAGHAVRALRKNKTNGMAIFFCKTRLGLRETTRHEVTGKDGGPVEVADARERLARRIAELAPGAGESGTAGEPDGAGSRRA